MQIWSNLLFILQIVAAVTMIGLVLLQHGKGADMGASFGSGASGSLFGASGSANFLSRSTAICATVFFAATLGMAAVTTGRVAARAPTAAPDNALVQPLSASGPASSGTAILVPSATASAASAPRGGVPTR
jgi:preprotein translocase subunit SecG